MTLSSWSERRTTLQLKQLAQVDELPRQILPLNMMYHPASLEPLRK
jgi:hypothetical protein